MTKKQLESQLSTFKVALEAQKAAGVSAKGLAPIEKLIADTETAINTAPAKGNRDTGGYAMLIWGKPIAELKVGDSVTYKELFERNAYTLANFVNVKKNAVWQGYLIEQYNGDTLIQEKDNARTPETKIVFKGIDTVQEAKYKANRKEKETAADNGATENAPMDIDIGLAA